MLPYPDDTSAHTVATLCEADILAGCTTLIGFGLGQTLRESWAARPQDCGRLLAELRALGYVKIRLGTATDARKFSRRR